MAEHHDFGQLGETKAVEYLIKQGYQILERNWRAGHRELDIFCTKDQLLVVVEVKTRELPEERPEELLDFRKRRNIRVAAEAYIRLRQVKMEVRFDLILVIGRGMQIRHIPDAIQIFE